MSCYWFNREELLKKANEKYHNKGGKQKASEYYRENKEAIKGKARNKYKKEKELKRQYSRNKYKKFKQQYKG